MSTRSDRRPGGDPLLLLEAVLALVLFALFYNLYLVPSQNRDAPRPEWWTWLALALPFFTLLAVDAWRRRRNRQGR